MGIICYNKIMKKLFLFILLFTSTFVFAGEPLLLMNPFRETFVNFPSAILPDKVITVFLPEPSVPLHAKYPVVYILGAWPKNAQAAQELIEKSHHKAILVGINIEEKDLADPAKIIAFFTQELVPYIDTNYLTIQEPIARAVVAADSAAVRVAAVLLSRPQFISRAALLTRESVAVQLQNTDKNLRVLLAGNRQGVVPLQKLLEDKQLVYGPGFAVKLTEETGVFSWWSPDYLFAPTEEVTVQKVEQTFEPQTVSIAAKQPISWSGKAILANQMICDWIALMPRVTPPYVQWNPLVGAFQVLPGALPGKVKITATVDKVTITDKIRLKK